MKNAENAVPKHLTGAFDKVKSPTWRTFTKGNPTQKNTALVQDLGHHNICKVLNPQYGIFVTKTCKCNIRGINSDYIMN